MRRARWPGAARCRGPRPGRARRAGARWSPAAGATPWPHSTRGVGSPAVTNTAGTSPPGPHMCGSTTCSTNPPATAASNALPPRARTAIAVLVARWWVLDAAPCVPRRSYVLGAIPRSSPGPAPPAERRPSSRLVRHRPAHSGRTPRRLRPQPHPTAVRGRRPAEPPRSPGEVIHTRRAWVAATSSALYSNSRCRWAGSGGAPSRPTASRYHRMEFSPPASGSRHRTRPRGRCA